MPSRLATAALAVAAPLAACKPLPLPGEPNAPRVAVETSVGGEEERPDPVVFEVAGRPVTIGEIDRRAQLVSSTAQLLLDSAQSRESLVEKLLWLELLANAADREQLPHGADEALLFADADARARLDAIATATVSRGDITAEDMTAAYESARPSLQRPAAALVSGLFFETEEQALDAYELLRPRARFVPVEALFAQLAPALGSTTDSTGPQLGWLGATDPEADPAIIRAVFASTEAGLREPVLTSRGWAVLGAARFREPLDVSIDDADGYLRQAIVAERIGQTKRAALDAARAESDVSVDADTVARLEAARALATVSAPARPRRFERDALAGAPEAVAGFEVLEAARAEAASVHQNPTLSAVAPADGSEPPAAEPE